MNKKDLYEFGDEIVNLVQDAVENQDFEQLSNTINKVVNEAADGMQEMIREITEGYHVSRSADEIRRRMQQQGRVDRSVYHNAAEMIRDEQRAKRAARAAMPRQADGSIRPLTVSKKTPGLTAGNILKFTGFGFTGIFGLSIALLGVVGVTTGISLMIPVGILGVLFGGSLAVGISGNQKVGLAKRFKQYSLILGDRTFCSIRELADGSGRTEDQVRKDLKKMIQKGFFPFGHIDQTGTCLITDREIYEQYLSTQRGYEERTAKEQESKEQQNKKAVQNKEAAALIEEGERYIRHIHACNEKIPGEAITEKLNRLESVVTRIFREVERRPELAPDMRKMMSYYLPTTQKLIDAYCQLDASPVAGQNMESTKKEIETALDTINKAFEKLLDSFFENTAWDISSDISVLNTMFAQEGLTGNSFGE